MTIHDELILALTKRSEEGEVPLHKIVLSNNIRTLMEETIYRELRSMGEWIKMTPDLIVTIAPYTKSAKHVVIELESDVKWDFAASLRQIKKYKQYLSRTQGEQYDVIVIIPKDYERYAPLYQYEGIPVWFWEATAEWICEKCGNEVKIIMNRPKILRKCISDSCNYDKHHLNKLLKVKFSPAKS